MKIMIDTMAEYCDTGLFPFMSHGLDQTVEDVCGFGTHYVLEASLFEQYNVQIKTSFGRIFKPLENKNGEDHLGSFIIIFYRIVRN